MIFILPATWSAEVAWWRVALEIAPISSAGVSAVAVIADVFAHQHMHDVARAARAFALLFAKPKRGGIHEP
jgi:hypothetical protein